MKYSNILFDLDGTITDPFIGITKSIKYALEKYGIEVSDTNELKSFIGPPLFDSFQRYASFSEEESVKAVEYYREYYIPKGIFECELYDGIEYVLKKLSENSCKIILATSKPEEMARTVLSHFSLDKYFDFICGATLDKSRSKKADIIKYAIKKANILHNDSVIMIGDTKFDILGAQECKIPALGVTYGYGSREELINSGALAIFDSANDLLKFLI